VSPTRKRIIIVAGPNGAGKTTFAREFLPNEADCPTFVNADLIAAGLSPFNLEVVAMRAGRIMLELIDDHVSRGHSFAFETTLAGNGCARQIPTWQAAGYHVTLLFLALPSAEAALQRVRERVAQAGHSVPEVVIRRRFAAGKLNFEAVYKPLVDAWALYDTSSGEPILLGWGEKVMNPKPIEQAKTPELALALPALRRARKRAEEIAFSTNTALIQVEDGQVVRVRPDTKGERAVAQ
jgi:predicted ABC-type ATPase